MEIRKQFPFDLCESCEECVLDVEEQIIYGDCSSCARIITVGCKNERLCRKLMKKGENYENQ